MKISTKYDFGDIVYLKTDKEQLQRMITAVVLRPTGIVYELSQGADSSNHYEFEMTKNKDVILATTD